MMSEEHAPTRKWKTNTMEKYIQCCCCFLMIGDGWLRNIEERFSQGSSNNNKRKLVAKNNDDDDDDDNKDMLINKHANKARESSQNEVDKRKPINETANPISLCSVYRRELKVLAGPIAERGIVHCQLLCIIGLDEEVAAGDSSEEV